MGQTPWKSRSGRCNVWGASDTDDAAGNGATDDAAGNGATDDAAGHGATDDGAGDDAAAADANDADDAASGCRLRDGIRRRTTAGLRAWDVLWTAGLWTGHVLWASAAGRDYRTSPSPSSWSSS